MIELKNSYLGYTDVMKPIQKSRVEDILDRGIISEGIRYSQKEFILNKLKENYIPYVIDDYCYYKRDGELTKPRADYRLKNKNGVYCTINKTLYDFALYLIENKFNDDETLKNFIITEQQRIENQEQQRIEIENQEQQKIEIEQMEKENFKNWLNNAVENYSNTERINIATEIFENEINQHSEYRIKALLVLIENINDDLCKEKLISWLNYHNKASKKVFYHITGIKLHNTNKATKLKLKTLKLNDYKECVKYQPRKKRKTKELKTFYKLERQPNIHFEECKGEEIIKYGICTYLIKDGKTYYLVEATSGCIVTTGETKKELFVNFKNFIKRNGVDVLNDLIQHQINLTGLSPLYC